MSPSLLHTIVKNTFAVSTIYRRSSARLSAEDWYYETMVFRLDKDGKKKEILDQSEASYESSAVTNHNNFVTKYVAECPSIEGNLDDN